MPIPDRSTNPSILDDLMYDYREQGPFEDGQLAFATADLTHIADFCGKIVAFEEQRGNQDFGDFRPELHAACKLGMDLLDRNPHGLLGGSGEHDLVRLMALLWSCLETVRETIHENAATRYFQQG